MPEHHAPEPLTTPDAPAGVRGAPSAPRREIETTLATTQGADGSFGGRIDRTASAVVALVCLGHTRRKGTRRRVVEKAARWLSQRQGEPAALLALMLLTRAEAGGDLPQRDEVTTLLGAGAEGEALNRALEMGC